MLERSRVPHGTRRSGNPAEAFGEGGVKSLGIATILPPIYFTLPIKTTLSVKNIAHLVKAIYRRRRIIRIRAYPIPTLTLISARLSLSFID